MASSLLRDCITAMHYKVLARCLKISSAHTATRCNTLQHSATHGKTLQHTATHCNTLLQSAIRCNSLQHSANSATFLHGGTTLHISNSSRKRKSLQHTAMHCNVLQHTATHATHSQGGTALHISSSSGKRESVELLLNNTYGVKANIAAVDEVFTDTYTHNKYSIIHTW